MPDEARYGAPRPDDEQYMVRSRLEILSVLRGLEEQRELVTAYFGEGRDFIVTMVLAVNPDFEEIVLDFGAEQRANARLMAAPRLFVVSQLARIRVQFWTGRADTTTFEDLPAFRVRLPSELMRLQRRQYYRVCVPARHGVRCDLAVASQDDATIATRVVNISCGGIAITDVPEQVRLEPGARLKGCTLTVDDGDAIETTLEIVRVAEVPLAHAAASRLVGMQFVDLSAGARARIQRYINRVEREQIARSHALQ